MGTTEEATGKNGQVCCIVFVFRVWSYFVLNFTLCVVSCDSSYFVLYCISMCILHHVCSALYCASEQGGGS